MIVAILTDVSPDWLQHLEQSPLREAMVLDASSVEAAGELLQAVQADVVVMELPRVTDERLSALMRLQSMAEDALTLCIAPGQVIEQMRIDEPVSPDLWLESQADAAQRDDVLQRALETITLRQQRDAVEDSMQNGCTVVQGNDGRPAEMEAFNRLMGGLSSGFDLDRLLEAFADAVSQFSQCAGYTLLWEADDGCLEVRYHRGLRAEIAEGARLSSDDALPTWYRRNRRVLTAAELADWDDRQLAAQVRRELDVFGGQIALPLMVRGRLAGVLMLGEKVLGESYSRGELETLFGVTNHVAVAAQAVELHAELGRSKAYTDSIVESMAAGLITLDTDERIAVCNPYAAEVLGVSREEVEGADLRALPSPLGDMLYAALKAPDDTPITEEVSIRGGEKTLRVSTSRVCDDSSRVLGSVLMLDDITAERELTRERNRRERLDVLTRIVGRIAHEVKNPLTAVKTYAELTTGRGGDEQLEKFWSETVLPEIDRLDDMLKNLLRMVEQPDPHMQTARVEDIVEQALDAVPIADDVKHQAFDLQFGDELPDVLVDPAPMRDAISYLLNYLAGTRPYTVQVQVERSEDDDDAVSVTMTRRTRTNGQFDPATIFDPLTAMQNPDSDLGPVISQKIITNQDGRIEAWHEDGRVTMRVTLPHSEVRVSSDQEVH